MAESYVQVSPDSTGKKIAAVVDDDSNYRQVVEIGGDGTDNFAQVTVSGAVKVDGSAVTQPVSGTVAVSGTVPVSGTFWQATQPVSGTVTAAPAVGSSLIAPARTTVAVTNTAVQLPSTAYAQGVIVQALAANSATVVIGGSGVTTGNGFQLAQGQSVTLPVNNSNLVYVNGTSGDGVCTIGV